MAVINKDIVLVVSLVLSVVSLVLLFGVTWYFQSSLDLLQQQVEYDRELLFKLQEQINGKGNDNSQHDVVKRQSEQNCQCKDGSPGPKGPPGNKGEIGMEGKQGRKGDTGPPGPRGDAGDRGPRGRVGDIGLRGEKGEKGDVGQRGDTGDRGPRGTIGDTGLRGPVGQTGAPGIQGSQGPRGYAGNTGDPGPKGQRGEMGYQGYRGPSGLKGEKGSSGSNGPKGSPGQKGIKGDKEERNGGTVYVRWGHNKCPSAAQLVYSGRAGGPLYTETGGGNNAQCLPLDPNFLPAITGKQWRAYMYGGEYETATDSNSHVHGVDQHDIPCAVCHVSNRTAVYMVPAKYTCPTGWTREYYGYLMSEYFPHPNNIDFLCVDTAFKSVPGSAASQQGMLLHFVEGRCGSLPCPPYDNTKELSCAVCTK